VKLTEISDLKFRYTLKRWEVDNDYAEPMYNYLVHGFNPGSFFSSVLANDFLGAVSHSHPGNSIPALKKLGGWIYDYMPREAFGSYKAVDAWCSATDEQRRGILEHYGLVLSEEQETWEILKGA
jgi:hypothetical protein